MVNIKTIYRRFQRRIDEMDDYERTRLYTITGISTLAFLILAGLIIFFSLRRMDVVVGVDTTGLLGKPAVFVNNMSSSPLKHVSVEMDGVYKAMVDKIRSRQSVVVYFTMFKPMPPQNYRPEKVTVKSGMEVMTKSISALTQ